MTGRPAEVEPFVRGCAWPAADWAAYPRCDPGPAGWRLPADTRRQAAPPRGVGPGGVRLAAGAGPARGIVYLPEGMRPVVTAIRAIGGEIAPAPPQRRWLCYGDSIAEGWCAAGPAGAWPARVGRDCVLDVINLGYAGGARGELASAEEIARLRADVISIAHGTNCWTR